MICEILNLITYIDRLQQYILTFKLSYFEKALALEGVLEISVQRLLSLAWELALCPMDHPTPSLSCPVRARTPYGAHRWSCTLVH